MLLLLKRGDRATCLYRDCAVIITGWSSAPDPLATLPLPRLAGAAPLLLDEELARAVRTESAATVMHWWDASMTAVCHWRKALGTCRTDNQGTARLTLASAAKGPVEPVNAWW